MTKLSQDTWVLIADGEKALFLQNHTDGKDPYLQVVRKEEQDILYKLAHKGRFERIVLVAPPAVLGDLRDDLHKEVRNKVVGEISKTLTNHPIDEIEKIVAGELAQA